MPRRTLQIGATGIEALRRTRPWAIFICVLAFLGAVYYLVDLVLMAVGFSLTTIPAIMHPALMKFTMTIGIILGMLSLVLASLYGWFSLQYSRQIKLCMDTLNPQRFEGAMQWQRRYWTLQGVALIILIVLTILFVIAVIVISAIVASHGGFQP